MPRALVGALSLAGLAGTMGCKQQPDVYCIAMRYARADAGIDDLGSPFDALPAGSEISHHDVVDKPYLFITEKGKTTVSHLEHLSYDEALREERERNTVHFIGDENERHPVVRRSLGGEERLRYGFQGRRCLQWDLPVGCHRDVAEYMIVDMRCGPSMRWLQSQPSWPDRPKP